MHHLRHISAEFHNVDGQPKTIFTLRPCQKARSGCSAKLLLFRFESALAPLVSIPGGLRGLLPLRMPRDRRDKKARFWPSGSLLVRDGSPKQCASFEFYHQSWRRSWRGPSHKVAPAPGEAEQVRAFSQAQERLDTPLLSEELFVTVASFLPVSDVLTVGRLCRRGRILRDLLLADMLQQKEGIVVDRRMGPPGAVLSVYNFCQGHTVVCTRATLAPGADSDEGFLKSFFESPPQPNTPMMITASWQGIAFWVKRSRNQTRPPAHLKLLPWRCIMGWITVLRTTTRVGQIKLVARAPKDANVSYVTVWLKNPQLLHAKMISFCEAHARSLKGEWIFTRTGVR